MSITHRTDYFVKSTRVLLTEQEETDLFLSWHEAKEQGKTRQAERYFQEIIIQYTPLIKSMVRKLSGYNADKDELISEGLLALVEAANRFELSRGFRFSTYARSWIKGVLFAYITKSYFITNVCTNSLNKKLFFSMRRVIADEIKRSGQFEMHAGLAEKLAKEFGTTVEEILTMNNVLRSPYESLNEAASNAVSLSSGEEFEATKLDMLQDDSAGPEEITETENRGRLHKRLIAEAMEQLTDRERVIFNSQRMKDEKRDVETLEELGKQFSISKERVRQIRNAAKEKIEKHVREAVKREGLRSQLF